MMDYKNELNEYIETVLNRGASDLHISSGKKPYFRIERNLSQFMQKEELTSEDASSFLKLITTDKFDDVLSEIKVKKTDFV